MPASAVPNRWEKDIAAFEAADMNTPPPKKAVVFVGSSSIRMWDLAASIPLVSFIKRGFGGAQISDVVLFADRIITKYDPAAVVVYVGGVDIGRGRKAGAVYKDFLALCDRIHAKRKNTPILYVSIKPSFKKWDTWPEAKKANSLIRQHAAETSFVQYVDIVPVTLGDDGQPKPEIFRKDGGHLNAAGYHAWTKVLEPALKSALRASGEN